MSVADAKVVAVALTSAEYALLRAWVRASAGDALAAEIGGALVRVLLTRKAARDLYGALVRTPQLASVAEACGAALRLGLSEP